MKIIDLLNKIANEEDVPKYIKYHGWGFTYDRQPCDYYCEEYGNFFEYLINEKRTIEFLNDEVEIIEKKKIPEKLKDILRVDDLIPPVDENMYKIWKQTIKNQNKINEICDYLKSKGE